MRRRHLEWQILVKSRCIVGFPRPETREAVLTPDVSPRAIKPPDLRVVVKTEVLRLVANYEYDSKPCGTERLELLIDVDEHLKRLAWFSNDEATTQGAIKVAVSFLVRVVVFFQRGGCGRLQTNPDAVGMLHVVEVRVLDDGVAESGLCLL